MSHSHICHAWGCEFAASGGHAGRQPWSGNMTCGDYQWPATYKDIATVILSASMRLGDQRALIMQKFYSHDDDTTESRQSLQFDPNAADRRWPSPRISVINSHGSLAIQNCQQLIEAMRCQVGSWESVLTADQAGLGKAQRQSDKIGATFRQGCKCCS